MKNAMRLNWFLLGFVAVGSMACGNNGALTARHTKGANGQLMKPAGSDGALAANDSTEAANVLVQWNTTKQSEANYSEFYLANTKDMDSLNKRTAVNSALALTMKAILAKNNSEFKSKIRETAILADAYSGQLLIGVMENVQNPNIQSQFGVGIAVLLKTDNATTQNVINACASQLGLASSQSNWNYGFTDYSSVLLPIAEISPIVAQGAEAGAKQLVDMASQMLLELEGCVTLQALAIETF